MHADGRKVSFTNDGAGLALEGELRKIDDQWFYKRLGFGLTLCTLCNRKLNNEGKSRRTHIKTQSHQRFAAEWAAKPADGKPEKLVQES